MPDSYCRVCLRRTAIGPPRCSERGVRVRMRRVPASDGIGVRVPCKVRGGSDRHSRRRAARVASSQRQRTVGRTDELRDVRNIAPRTRRGASAFGGRIGRMFFGPIICGSCSVLPGVTQACVVPAHRRDRDRRLIRSSQPDSAHYDGNLRHVRRSGWEPHQPLIGSFHYLVNTRYSRICKTRYRAKTRRASACGDISLIMTSSLRPCATRSR